MGGAIAVDSTFGAGSRFSFTLPLVLCDGRADGAAGVGAPDTALKVAP